VLWAIDRRFVATRAAEPRRSATASASAIFLLDELRGLTHGHKNVCNADDVDRTLLKQG